MNKTCLAVIVLIFVTVKSMFAIGDITVKIVVS